MTKILIADAGKASLVMSSEVFKDKIPGSFVHVARSGSEMLQLIKEHKPDMCVVDFDLPDVDGVTLIGEIRRCFTGPVLLTAYPDSVVDIAVKDNLFAYDDAGGWLPKPIRAENLSEKIDKFLIGKHRVWHRFDAAFPTHVVGKGAGRGKRAPKADGSVVNVSLEGICVRLSASLSVKAMEEVTVSMRVPVATVEGSPAATAAKAPTTKPAKPAKTPAKAAPKAPPSVELTFKGRVRWLGQGGKMAGLHFDRMNDAQRRSMEGVLRGLARDARAVD